MSEVITKQSNQSTSNSDEMMSKQYSGDDKEIASFLMTLKHHTISPKPTSPSLTENDKKSPPPPFVPVAQAQMQSPTACPPFCMPLASEDDHKFLSKEQCFLRTYCCELFVTTSNKASVDNNVISDSEHNTMKVGVRCSFCKHISPQSKASDSTFFLRTFEDIYESVAMLQSRHLLMCSMMPIDMKHTLGDLMQQRAGCQYEAPRGWQQYWIQSAIKNGLVQTPCGIRFQPRSLSSSPSPTHQVRPSYEYSAPPGINNCTGNYNNSFNNSNAYKFTANTNDPTSISVSKLNEDRAASNVPQVAYDCFESVDEYQRFGTSPRTPYYKRSPKTNNISNHNEDSSAEDITTVPIEVSDQKLTQLMGETKLVDTKDKDLVPDYLYLAMAQMKPCRLTDADRVGCYKERDVGFLGMCCKHCGGQPGFGKYFPATIRSLAQTTTSQTIVKHIGVKCRLCPPEIRLAIVALQRDQTEKDRVARDAPGNSFESRPKYGSRKVFFQRLWARLHGGNVPGLPSINQVSNQTQNVITAVSPKTTKSRAEPTFTNNNTNHSKGRHAVISPHFDSFAESDSCTNITPPLYDSVVSSNHNRFLSYHRQEMRNGQNKTNLHSTGNFQRRGGDNLHNANKRSRSVSYIEDESAYYPYASYAPPPCKISRMVPHY